MTSLILQVAVRVLMPLLLMFSIFLLVRGHNLPGGGFSGGLVAASAWALFAIVYGAAAARRALRVDPLDLIAAGLGTILASGAVGLFAGRPFLTGRWGALDLGGYGVWPVGTPLLFDFGVYLSVIGVVLTIIFVLEEE
jgi:multicomponent Na+:H+ antiporter subunit B